MFYVCLHSILCPQHIDSICLVHGVKWWMGERTHECQIKEQFQECLCWLGHWTYYKLDTVIHGKPIPWENLLISMRGRCISWKDLLCSMSWSKIIESEPLEDVCISQLPLGLHSGLNQCLIPSPGCSQCTGRTFVSHHFVLKLTFGIPQVLHVFFTSVWI